MTRAPQQTYNTHTLLKKQFHTVLLHIETITSTLSNQSLKIVRIVWDGWWLTAGNGLDVKITLTRQRVKKNTAGVVYVDVGVKD